jgi:hypothetical protein
MCESDCNWLANIPPQTSTGQAFDRHSYVQLFESEANVYCLNQSLDSATQLGMSHALNGEREKVEQHGTR